VADLAAYTDALEQFLDEEGGAEAVVGRLEDRVDSLAADVEAVEETVGDLRSNVESTVEDVAAVEADVEAVDSEVESVAGDVERVDGDVDRLEGDLESVRDDLARLDDHHSHFRTSASRASEPLANSLGHGRRSYHSGPPSAQSGGFRIPLPSTEKRPGSVSSGLTEFPMLSIAPDDHPI
jgi:chromosome segregation ATPase